MRDFVEIDKKQQQERQKIEKKNVEGGGFRREWERERKKFKNVVKINFQRPWILSGNALLALISL